MIVAVRVGVRDQRDLAEMVAGAERPDFLAAMVTRAVPDSIDEESGAALPFRDDFGARRECPIAQQRGDATSSLSLRLEKRETCLSRFDRGI